MPDIDDLRAAMLDEERTDSLALTIGRYEWHVHFGDEHLDEGVWGQTDHEQLSIYIRDSLPDVHKTTTLLHEVMHVVLAHAGHVAHDELIVAALGIGLMDVLAQNPSIKEYLLEATRED